MWWGEPSWGWTMPFGPLVLFVAVVVGVSMIMWSGMRPPRSEGRSSGQSPREILDERYARGEIDRAEYEAKRHDLAA